MEESRKLSGRDLITIGIFSAIYFVLNLAAMFTGFVPVLWLLLPGVTGIVTGIPFLLMTAKVRKPGAVFIMGTITALLYFVTGQFTVLLLITFAIACIQHCLCRRIPARERAGRQGNQAPGIIPGMARFHRPRTPAEGADGPAARKSPPGSERRLDVRSSGQWVHAPQCGHTEMRAARRPGTCARRGGIAGA